jgi:hypothetical protein
MNERTPEHPPQLAPLPGAYGALFDRAHEVCWSDERVRALWLSGSVARGAADAGSDLDVIVTVQDDAFAAFAASWQDWLAQIAPTIIARALPGSPGSFYAVTETWERLDVIFERVSAVPTTPYRIRITIFDRDDLTQQLPAYRPEGPSAERAGRLIEEAFRIHGLLPAVLARRDWLLGVEGVHTLRTLLYQLFAEGNAPLPPMGVKQWSSRLSQEQCELLERLPLGAPNRQAIIAGHRAVVQAFMPAAKALALRLQMPWPEHLERKTADYLYRELGITSLAARPAD